MLLFLKIFLQGYIFFHLFALIQELWALIRTAKSWPRVLTCAYYSLSQNILHVLNV